MNHEIMYQTPLTEGNRAIQLFTDRNKFVRLFAESLNEDPPEGKILFFHGDGGNGKSLLLNFLRKKCCKRFEKNIWQDLRAIKNDAVFANKIESAEPQKDCILIPSSLLDFDQPPLNEDDTKNRFYGLLNLRKKIATAISESGYPRLRFPLYDFACFWYLYKKGKSSQEIKNLLPSEGIELLGVLIDYFFLENHGGIANLIRSLLSTVTKPLLSGVTKSLEEKMTLLKKQWGLDKEWIEKITEMDVDKKLLQNLSIWFAQDLNVAIKKEKAPDLLVLFFDTHEAFWGEQRDWSKYSFFFQDEWLRLLLNNLNSKKIIPVIAGREKPRWSEVANPQSHIPNDRLNTQLVWHLSDKDALHYLQKAGIDDEGLQKALINYASASPDQVHPFYLGLCADVVLTAKAKDTMLSSDDFANIPEMPQMSKVLIERLLKYIDERIERAIEVLSACRNFDFEFYQKLGKSLEFNADYNAFDILVNFSFVWKDKNNLYHIHDLIRRVYNNGRNPVTLRTHAGLEKYYRKQGNVSESLYHLICRDTQAGKKELIREFQQAKAKGDFELCQKLVDIRSEMSLYLDR